MSFAVLAAGFAVVLVGSMPASATTLFVDADRPNGGNGLSWATAFRDLQNALDAARLNSAVDQIWVAEGTYFPDRGTHNRNATFDLVSDVQLYGGFAGNETALEQRDLGVLITTLSGDLQHNDQPSFGNIGDNSRHVVSGLDLTGAVIDGFVIRSGNADFNGDLLLGGGGMFVTSSDESGDLSSVVVRKCTFRACSAGQTFAELGNFGGALLLRGASGTVTECLFEENRGNSGGALGLFDMNAADVDVDMDVLVTDCEFTRNVAPTQVGGAIYSAIGHAVTSSEVGTITMQRCRFAGNTAGYWGAWGDFNATFLNVEDCEFLGNSSDVTGGAMGHIQTGGPDEHPAEFHGCLFRNNTSDGAGGGLWIGAADAIVVDCVFQGNTTVGGGGGLLTTTYFTQNGAQDLTAVNCIFDGNVGNDGAALLSADNPILRLVNCTFANNHSTIAPTGGVTTEGAFIDVDNTVFWGNTGPSGVPTQPAQIRHDNGGPISINWSLVQGLTGSFGGQGNLGGNPLFVNALGPDALPGTGDEDLRPGAGSPCIDAGNNAAVSGLVTLDQSGEPRFVNDPGTPDTGQGSPPLVDLGALEFQPVATGVAEGVPLVSALGCVAVPNPAREACEIRFEAPASGAAPLAIYDIRGARVRSWAAPTLLASGAVGVSWDGRDAVGRRVPSGVYFARVGTALGRVTVRIVRLQ